jgi:amino acid permease
MVNNKKKVQKKVPISNSGIIGIIILAASLILFYLYVNLSDTKNKHVLEGYADGDTCTLTLNNINPMFVKNYKQYDNSIINCFNRLTSGFCVNSKLKMEVNPAPTDENGIPNQDNRQSSVIVNSNGTTTKGTPEIGPWSLPDYFCLKNK